MLLVDAHAWCRVCSLFKSASVSLCNALAGIASHLCTSIVHSEGISALVARQLIPPSKNPGVRLVGIGEVPRHIIAKCILKVVGNDVQETTGPSQACFGHKPGCEAAIHAMNEIVSLEETEAVIFVNTSIRG